MWDWLLVTFLSILVCKFKELFLGLPLYTVNRFFKYFKDISTLLSQYLDLILIVVFTPLALTTNHWPMDIWGNVTIWLNNKLW